MSKKYFPTIIISIFLGIASIAFVSSKLLAQKQELRITTSNPVIDNLPQLNSILGLQTALRTIASNITPGVVSIDIEGSTSINNIPNDPFFQFFFGDNENLKRQYNSTGSGFIITPDGYLFSNWHVVKDASKIQVTLADQRTFEARLIGADTELDIALLKIDGQDLPVVPIGNSDETMVGDLVVAIGNPFGLSSTFTFGAVSGLGREGVLPGLQRFIQSDVAVNPGNSGGPLLNIRGQAVGINTAIRSRSGGYEGISFAIPINTARHIAEQLFTSGTVERGFLGVVPQSLDVMSRQALKLNNNEGILISSLEASGPADQAGLVQGDIITKVDGQSVSSPAQLTEIIATKAPKSTVQLEIVRNNKRNTIIVTLGKRPSALVRGNSSDSSDNKLSDTFSFKGIQFASATSEDLKRNGASQGVVIRKTDPNSPFSFILSTGDVIGAINNTEISSLEDLKATVEQHQNSKTFVFLIYRKGFLIYRSIQLR
ncbi:MAG: Do family serine endopeptidase [Brevinemataceae bacterium]